MSVDEKEAEALKLLEEVARERHRGGCALIRVELHAATHVLEVIDRAAGPTAPSSS